jgi:hypothetical protein
MKCPACGDEGARIIKGLWIVSRAGVHSEFDYDVTACDACGEETLTFEQAEAQSHAYKQALARLPRLSDARERIREAWGELEQVFLDEGSSAAWIAAATELWARIDAALGATDSLAGAPVPAVDPSRSTPDAEPSPTSGAASPGADQ